MTPCRDKAEAQQRLEEVHKRLAAAQASLQETEAQRSATEATLTQLQADHKNNCRALATGQQINVHSTHQQIAHHDAKHAGLQQLIAEKREALKPLSEEERAAVAELQRFQDAEDLHAAGQVFDQAEQQRREAWDKWLAADQDFNRAKGELATVRERVNSRIVTAPVMPQVGPQHERVSTRA